jgi:hypothetical protein
MATVAYTQARMLVDGAELSTSLHELTLEYQCEMLDATTFGYQNRRFKGGLFHSMVSGKGFAEFGGDGTIEYMLFNRVGTDNTVMALFPTGITEGSTCGYALLGVEKEFKMGGNVGTLLDIDFQFEGRGLLP